MKSQFLIASVGSGGGKTTFMLGLLRALQKKKVKVQPFKCGPDCIDTQYHKLISNSDSINLDTRLASSNHIQYIYNTYGERADVCIVEGSTGLFDGYRKEQGSNAEIARLLHIPVILSVNAKGISYSVAPLLFGFKNFNPSVKIAGVVFTNVVSPSHFQQLKDACRDAGMVCLGYLPFDDKLRFPSRYSALTVALKTELNDIASRIAEQIEAHVDLHKLLDLCMRVFPCSYTLPCTSEAEDRKECFRGNKKLRITVACDVAFNYLFQENLDRLSDMGRITCFSPIYSKELPDCDMLYLPGGVPELFARQLHRRKDLLKQIKDYVESGGKVLAECGGVALLAQSLISREGGSVYAMSGALPVSYTMEQASLKTGYRTIIYPGGELKGYEFHYAHIVANDGFNSVRKIYGPDGLESDTPIYRYKNVIAGQVRWYFGESDPWKLW